MTKASRLSAPSHRISLLLMGIMLFVTQCTAPPSSEEQAMLAAKGYYEHLVAGEYDQFLEGCYGIESDFPASYREELVVALKQFMAQQRSQHRGINAVRAVRAKVSGDADAEKSSEPLQPEEVTSADVFLVLCFGDSTNEEIVVPMVLHDNRWKMK